MKVIRPAALDSSNIVTNVPEVAVSSYVAGTTYAENEKVSITSGTTYYVYRSLAGSNIGNNPSTSPAWWQLVATTYAEYSEATTYALGDTIISAAYGDSTHRIYESIVASNVGNALTDATKWLDIGPTNALAMFDTINGTATASSDGIDVTATMTGSIDGLGLFGLVAEQVQVTVSTAADGTVYDQTYSLVSDSGISDWYSYFFEEIAYSRDLVITDLPLYYNPTIRVQITGTGEIQCGTMVLGQTKELGGTNYGARAGIQDYSKKTADDFGNYTIVPRAYAKRQSLKVICDNTKVDDIYNALADLRTTPCVWVGSDAYSSTWSFGYWKDVVVEIAYVNKSVVSLEIEGLT